MHALGPDRGRGRVGTNKCDQMLIDQGLGPCIEPTRTVVHSITPALRFNTHTRYIRLNNAIIMSNVHVLQNETDRFNDFLFVHFNSI